MMNLNYFENVNTGYLIDIYYPEYVWIVNNVFYNTGQFSLALSSNYNPHLFFLTQNIFVNSNIMETYPSWNYDQTKIGHIKYWASNNNQITLSANQYLNQNIHAFIGNEDMSSQNEYFGSSGDLSQRVLDEFYGESTISGAVANLRNSSLDEHELDIKAQPKLIYQNGSFQLDFPADYEALHDQFSYILEISDGVNDPVIEQLDITISDVNEPPLIISNDRFSINENNDEIGVILALDPENDELFYSSDDEAFSFQGNNLFFTTPPDYEEQSLYTTTVSISDGNNSTSKYIEVQILDVDEEPQFTSTSNFNIDENSFRVGKITATDGDGDDVTIYVEDANFYLNDSNVLFFNNAPDYELQTNYEVVVFATDGSNIASETINIGINNLNDNPPVLNSYIYYVDENTEGPIATLDVTDADGDDISFPYFESWGSINSEGQIFVPNIPDYETSDQYNGSILISDGVNEISEHIYIYVNNLNDNAPSFTFTGPFSAPENQLYVDNLISATDDDGDDLTFSLANEDAADLWIFSSNSEGNLVFNNAPNFEEKDSYSFDVIVSDGVFSASERITVAITDQNDLPQFTSSSIFYSDENQQAIGTVVATDEDGQSLVYSISSYQDDGRGVIIDGVTGTLFFDADELPDYEDGASRTVTVTATEQSDAQMSSIQSVQISINNLNDNEPTILGYNEYGGIDVDENSSFVKDFDVVDSDGDLNEHVFSISGIDADVFTLESSGGRLVFTHSGQVDHENPLDDDANNDYEITISVTDGLYTNSTDFTINVLNLNDNSPVFTCEPDNGNPNYEFQCVDTVITIDESDERTPNEQETVGVFTANDPDGDLLTFSIPTDSGLYSNWSLLNNTNNLSLFDGEDLSYSVMKSFSDAADYEVASSYSGHILVSDGENTESRAVTINLNNINDNTPETTFTCYEEIQPADSLNYCYVDENDSSFNTWLVYI